MNRFALILVCPLLLTSVSRASAPSAPEDGIFDVKLSAPGQADIVDRLYLTDGQFDSRACRGLGFAKAACTLGEAGGGPCTYAGRSMKDAHVKLDISEVEWTRMVEIFVVVLDQYKAPKPEQEELLAIVGTTKGDIVVRK